MMVVGTQGWDVDCYCRGLMVVSLMCWCAGVVVVLGPCIVRFVLVVRMGGWMTWVGRQDGHVGHE